MGGAAEIPQRSKNSGSPLPTREVHTRAHSLRGAISNTRSSFHDLARPPRGTGDNGECTAVLRSLFDAHPCLTHDNGAWGASGDIALRRSVRFSGWDAGCWSHVLL
jgi:hypothetical protein